MPVVLHEDGFLIDFEIPAQNVRLQFSSAKSVVDFCQVERRFWDKAYDELFRLQHHPWLIAIDPAGRSAAQELLKRIEEVAEAEKCASALREFEQSSPILALGKYGILISQQMDQKQNAEDVLSLLVASSISIGNRRLVQQIRGQPVSQQDLIKYFVGVIDISKFEASGHLHQTIIRSLIDELQDLLVKYKSEVDHVTVWAQDHRVALEEKLSSANDETRRLIDEWKTSVSDELIGAQTKLAEQLQKHQRELEDFKKQVRIDVVNEVPTTFWNKKARGHLITAIIFGLMFVGVVGGTIYWIEHQAIEAVLGATDRLSKIGDNAASVLIPLTLLTIPGLALAWTLRHISRVIVQNLALHADARLRGTITSTFRALAADRTMTETELALALQALFRPIDGRDHAEVAPPNFADILKLKE